LQEQSEQGEHNETAVATKHKRRSEQIFDLTDGKKEKELDLSN